MKKYRADTIMQGAVIAALALFGFRGILPDLVGEQFPLLIGISAVALLGLIVGRFVYECPPLCDPKVCRITK